MAKNASCKGFGNNTPKEKKGSQIQKSPKDTKIVRRPNAKKILLILLLL